METRYSSQANNATLRILREVFASLGPISLLCPVSTLLGYVTRYADLCGTEIYRLQTQWQMLAIVFMTADCFRDL